MFTRRYGGSSPSLSGRTACSVSFFFSAARRTGGRAATSSGSMICPPRGKAPERASAASSSLSPQNARWSGLILVRTVAVGTKRRGQTNCRSGETALFSAVIASVSAGRLESHHFVSATLAPNGRSSGISPQGVSSRGKTPVIRLRAFSPQAAKAE
ncbi:hypothetical protein SDC9_193857 [bioreactor metagenome]|uniref:Uncharacterized protein n=1 Tax=bioreactor metagenome TaxID=1076179 RepID=A0A645I646_9ZZZZ